MPLYLVQHGKPPSPWRPTPSEAFSKDGRAEVERIADTARGYGVKVSQINHSGKKRAMQTAELFAEMLGPGIAVNSVKGMDPGDNVITFSDRLDADIEHDVE